MPDVRGYLLPVAGLVALCDDDGVSLLDAQGVEVARLSGGVGQAALARFAGEQTEHPTLDLLAAQIPGLQAALAETAQPLTVAAALRGTGWLQLFVELTGRCNERCLHCYAEAGPQRSDELPLAAARAVIREGAQLGFQVLQLTGGEALLRRELAELVGLGREAGIPLVEVFTNGTLLDEARYAELSAVEAAFAFSLYAADPAVHDEVTRLPGSHARTVAAIRRALAGGSRVRVGVIATRSQDEAEAGRALELAVELGVPEQQLHFETSKAVGRGEAFGGKGEDPSGLAMGDGPAVRSGHGAGEGGKAAVLPDGRVVPCIFSRDHVLGRVGPEGGLIEALQSPAVTLGSLAPERLAARLRTGRAAQSCAGCRLATALLQPAGERPAGRLLPLGGGQE